jgi:type IV secretory pathway VirB2 component (pilin)
MRSLARAVPFLAVFAAVFLFSDLAHAAASDPMQGFFDKMLDWVIEVIAPAVVVLSIIAAGICWAVMGSQEGLRKAMSAAIGAGIIYGAGSLYQMIASAAGH